jgi:putative ABC transport system substrate-binding protein
VGINAMKKYFISLMFLFIAVVVTCTPASAGHIGVIMTGDIPYYNDVHKAFLAGMGDQAHEVVVQKPMPDPMSWTNAARKISSLGSDVIVSYGAPATLTTMKVTSDIPIVFAGVYAPDAMGLTGKNATGISSTVPIEMILKKMNAISKLSNVAIILSKAEKDSILQTKVIKKIEASYGFKSTLISVKGKVDKSKLTGFDAIIVTTCSAGMINIKDILEVGRNNKIPTVALLGGAENDGVILTVTADAEEQGKELAEMVKKVIGGAKPSGMAVIKPKKIGVILNMKEAELLGFSVPENIKSSATRIIK